MSTPIYYIKNGQLNFGQKTIFSNLDLYLHQGDKICLIGSNGSGKSSLLKILSGTFELTNGEQYQDPSMSVAYLPQNTHIHTQQNLYQFIFNTKEYQEKKYLADSILSQLELDGLYDISSLSGGQLRRLQLAKVLVEDADVILLDEPTNHLDIGLIKWLENYFHNSNKTIVCISHDKHFLINVTDKIWWLDRAIMRKCDKNFKYFAQWQEDIIEHETRVLRNLSKKVDEENYWLVHGITARRRRNERRLEQLIQMRSKLKQQEQILQSAKKKMLLNQHSEIKRSKLIIEITNLSFSYDNKKILRDFNLKIQKGQKIGIVGRNGSGKTTFIKLLLGETYGYEGKIAIGKDLRISYIDQNRAEVKPDMTLQYFLCPNGGNTVSLSCGRTMHVAAYLKQFMFDPKLFNAKIAILSGGEMNRLLLAKVLINPGDVLILDEPTNDLDMDTIEILLEYLFDYSGTIIVVSHDRDFIDRIATHTIGFEGDAKVNSVIGGFSDYTSSYPESFEVKQIKSNKTTQKTPTETKTTLVTKNKLSYKDKREKDMLGVEIPQIEEKIKLLELELNNPNLFASDLLSFNTKAEEYNLLKIELDNKILRLLELEDLDK